MTPILLFAYNRPLHLRRTLDSLFEDKLAYESNLFIFCDGVKSTATTSQRQSLEEVYSIANREKRAAEVKVYRQEKNIGLAKNIRFGIDKVLEEYDSVIVLEDDLIVGQGFLQYMNESLSTYASNPEVMQVSGFQFPFNESPSEPLFMPVIVTTGWATWKRVWSQVDFRASGYERLKSDSSLRHRFNLDGDYDYSSILVRQLEQGARDSWGVLFWWHVFKGGGQVLYPGYSLIQHSDNCGSGTHISNYDHYDWPNWDNKYRVGSLPDQVKFSESGYGSLRRYLRKSRRKRISLPILWRKLMRKLFPV